MEKERTIFVKIFFRIEKIEPHGSNHNRRVLRQKIKLKVAAKGLHKSIDGYRAEESCAGYVSWKTFISPGKSAKFRLNFLLVRDFCGFSPNFDSQKYA